MNQASSIIELNSITKTYQSGDQILTVLTIPYLSITQHEWVSIIGPSGSGKTTLLHILGCLDLPRS
jgi:putative ABC transport system ATP-binding protein